MRWKYKIELNCVVQVEIDVIHGEDLEAPVLSFCVKTNNLQTTKHLIYEVGCLKNIFLQKTKVFD